MSIYIHLLLTIYIFIKPVKGMLTLLFILSIRYGEFVSRFVSRLTIIQTYRRQLFEASALIVGFVGAFYLITMQILTFGLGI